jgi:hypothetical protein
MYTLDSAHCRRYTQRMQTPFQTILAAEARFGLPPLFYARLLEEHDDWSFLVKIHALFEGALSLVAKHVSTLPDTDPPPDMTDWDDLSYPARLEIALQLGVLEPDFYRFLLWLGKARNQLVHNLKFLNFNLRKYYDNLNLVDRDFAIDAIGAGWKDMSVSEALKAIFNGVPVPSQFDTTGFAHSSLREVVVNLSPRAALWYAGVFTLDLLSLKLHFRRVHGNVLIDPSLEPNLQDLLLDPAVIQFKRDLFGNTQASSPAEQDKTACLAWMGKYLLADIQQKR